MTDANETTTPVNLDDSIVEEESTNGEKTQSSHLKLGISAPAMVAVGVSVFFTSDGTQ